MFDFVGHPVLGLVRRQFGPIQLGPLKEGRVRELSKIEVGALLKAAEGGVERAPRPRVKPGKAAPAKNSKRR
jgi:hypothetical protein